MDLIFWRHADALDAVDGQEDLLRELTPKGEKQAAINQAQGQAASILAVAEANAQALAVKRLPRCTR